MENQEKAEEVYAGANAVKTGSQQREFSPLAGYEVDPNCDGSPRECIFRNPEMLHTDLPCGQRCLTQSTGRNDSKAWYRFLVRTVLGNTNPVYVAGISAFRQRHETNFSDLE